MNADKYTPSKEQVDKIEELRSLGYIWDKKLSLQAAGVIMKKGNDIWFFGLDYSIQHNPEGISIITR